MKKLILLVLYLFTICCDNTELDIIPFPTEFPLDGTTLYIYERNDWSKSEDYLLDINSDTTYIETLKVSETLENYSIWSIGNSEYGSLVKNYENKFLFIGSINEDGIEYSDIPFCNYDFSVDFDKDSLDIDSYKYPPGFNRNEIKITKFGKDYECYNFSSQSQMEYNDGDTVTTGQDTEICQFGRVNSSNFHSAFELNDTTYIEFNGRRWTLLEIIKESNP